MRDQQRILFTTILGAKTADGSLKFDAGFLPFADLLDSVREIVKHLYGAEVELSRHTVQGWYKAGVLTEYNQDRTTRNRLYCGYDLIKVASVVYLVHAFHLSAETAGVIADTAAKVIDKYSRPIEASASESNREIHPTDFILAIRNNDEWTILCTEDREVFYKYLSFSGSTIVFNHNLLGNIAVPILFEKWKEKALWLQSVINRELSKKKGAK